MTHGAMETSLFDILLGDEGQKNTAEETKNAILAEFDRLGGGAGDGNQCV